MTGASGDTRAATVRRCGTALVVVALLAGVKSVQLVWWPDPGGATTVPGLVRQAVLAMALFVAVAIHLGARSGAAAAGLSRDVVGGGC